jgi:hypothetical protein
MDQWLSNLSPFETYLIPVPAIMLGSIVFLGGIILLLESETLAAIGKALEEAAKLNNGERQGSRQKGKQLSCRAATRVG